jgi:hypothetical protein
MFKCFSPVAKRAKPGNKPTKTEEKSTFFVAKWRNPAAGQPASYNSLDAQGLRSYRKKTETAI